MTNLEYLKLDYNICGKGRSIVEGACDCDGNVLDCMGICGGKAMVDCAGDCNGISREDECGVCDGPGKIMCWNGLYVCDEKKCPPSRSRQYKPLLSDTTEAGLSPNVFDTLSSDFKPHLSDNLVNKFVLDQTANSSLSVVTNHPGNPSSNRYWKNIVPKDYDVLAREGVTVDEDNITIDELSPQEWLGSHPDLPNDSKPYYYPVLPKLNRFGDFDEQGDDGSWKFGLGLQGIGQSTPLGFEGRLWNEDDFYSYITNPNLEDDSLLIDIESEEIERNIFNDRSGNDFVGVGISDYKIKFNNQTTEPSKNNFVNKINLSGNRDGAS